MLRLWAVFNGRASFQAVFNAVFRVLGRQSCLVLQRLHPINQDVEQEPNHIHKMPIPSCTFKTKMAFAGEVAVLQAQGDKEQHQHAQEDMEAMEAREHEESGAIHA